LNGQELRLSEAMAVRPVVLAFYKASCPTCQLTFPYLQRIYSEFRAEPGSTIWGISQDEFVETREFVREYGIQFDVLIDEHPYAVSAAYGLEFVPAIFVVGTDGKIRISDYGFSKATLSEIAKPFRLFAADDGLPATRPG
jgi:peroxiredoxin